jgi:mRNA interferase MazF
MNAERFGVYLISPDPTLGAEMRKTRPCVVLSPDEMNRALLTVIVAPLTSSRRRFPFRIDSHFSGKVGQIALDQLRSVGKLRLVKRLGRLERKTSMRALDVLQEMFSP